MDRRFDEELKTLKERLLVMGGLAETMIQTSIQALVERDEILIQRVYQQEETMDQLCIEIDDRCFTLLALRQPVASDLRFIAASIKLNSELERIGDLAVNTAREVSSLITQPFVKPLIDIPRMARLAQEMVRRSLDAFVKRDPELARLVIEADDEIDHLRDQVFRELLTYMMGDPSTIPRALDLILVSRHLERIADHATNIAEDVIYIVRGEDVRERGEKEIRKGLRRREQPGPSVEAGRIPLGVIPEEEEFYELIRLSAKNAMEAARALQEMFEHPTDLEEEWRRLEGFERGGDQLTHRIIRKLNQTFIPPLDRRDLHALTSALDDVVDAIEAVAARMVLYRILAVTPEARELAGLIVASTEEIVKALASLPTLKGVEGSCIELNRLENQADEVYRKAIAGLFHGESSALEILKWKELYELLETTTDRCEDVANVVEAVALKHP